MKKNFSDYLQYDAIHPVSLAIIRLSLKLSCFLLSLALLAEVWGGELTARTYEIHYLAAELYRLPQGLLLLAFIAAAVINDQL